MTSNSAFNVFKSKVPKKFRMSQLRNATEMKDPFEVHSEFRGLFLTDFKDALSSTFTAD